ncbi:hypothetical protein MTO96_009252 [Rhipicephalus appendiculatus]
MPESTFFCIGSYVFGTYRTLGNTGWIFDILLGLETGVNLVSDFTLLSALQTSAVVVTKLRNFLTLNTGTILFCCVTHIGASYYVAQYVYVDGAIDDEEEQSVRNNVFAQLALFYVFLATVKGAILYNIYGYYRDFKDQPPPINAIFVINPVDDQAAPVVFVDMNLPPPQGAVAANQPPPQRAVAANPPTPHRAVAAHRH